MLVEVNCETDFVARGDVFKQLVADMAMQVAANSDVHYISVDEVDPAVVEKEREIQMGKEDIQSKPEAIRLVSGVQKVVGDSSISCTLHRMLPKT